MPSSPLPPRATRTGPQSPTAVSLALPARVRRVQQEQARTVALFAALTVAVALALLVVLLAGPPGPAAAHTGPAAAHTGSTRAGSVEGGTTDDHRITLPIDPAHLDQVHWSDTWGAPRSGGRSHIGVDMMGPKGVPLRAANDSVVTWGRFDNAGGTLVRLRDSAGWEYQYIHINNDTPGTDDGDATCLQALAAKLCETLRDGRDIERGVAFEAGEVIGYLGDSGNAEWTGAHLHFEVYRPDGEGGVVAVNPTPYVDEALARLRGGGEPVGPFDNAYHAADVMIPRLEGRDPTGSEHLAVVDAVERGGLPEALAGIVDGNPSAAMIDRLYLAFFLREPDTEGWEHWIGTHAAGNRLEDIAEWFAESREFQRRYEGTDFSQFLDQLYLDVLGRTPDIEGKNYWLGLLRDGRINRGTIVVYFTEGAELRRAAESRTELTVIHRAMGWERPTPTEFEAWAALRQATSLQDAISSLMTE